MVRTAIITGAAQGIGRAIALRLAEDGCNVVLNDLASKQIALQALVDDINSASTSPSRVNPSNSKLPVATYVLGDVSVEDDVKKMIQTAVATFGALDIMVANAGVVMNSSIIETSLADFDRVLSINTKGTFLCVKLSGEQMIKQGTGGRIIVASSVCGKKGQILWVSGTHPHIVLQSSLWEDWCKSQLSSLDLIKSLSTHTLQALYKLQCASFFRFVSKPVANSVAASSVENMDEVTAARNQLNPGQFMDGIRQSTALKELGKPEYIADAVSFLASDKGCYITGQTLGVDAGMLLA
ncbi:hypothetical protein H1R20_g9778, partial [Candolleomyces eurysporus]